MFEYYLTALTWQLNTTVLDSHIILESVQIKYITDLFITISACEFDS